MGEKGEEGKKKKKRKKRGVSGGLAVFEKTSSSQSDNFVHFLQLQQESCVSAEKNEKL